VLAELAAGLEDDAAALGVRRETRDYRPHVTLARFKRPGDARAVLGAANIEPLVVECRTARLYRSELGPSGSRYTVLAEQQLG
jgi:2'-5' RNA ligase